MYCYTEFKLGYLEFKLSYLENLKFNQSKRIIWAYNFVKKRRRVFALFKAFSRETDLWVTLGDFALENTKFEKKICVLLKINLMETKFSVRRIIAIIWVTCVKKNIQIRTLNLEVIGKVSIFQEIPPNFTSSQKS